MQRGWCGAVALLVWVVGFLGFVVTYLLVRFGKQHGPWAVLAVLAPTALVFLAPWLLAVGLPYLRGRRDRDKGVSCAQCGKTAFPVEGTTSHYRCWNCGCRFEAQQHF